MKGLAVGRIIHYIGYNNNHHAAIITYVEDPEIGRITLTVFTNDPSNPTCVMNGIVFKSRAEDDNGGTPNTWHWVEFV